jgi:serine/threonine protein kinase
MTGNGQRVSVEDASVEGVAVDGAACVACALAHHKHTTLATTHTRFRVKKLIVSPATRGSHVPCQARYAEGVMHHDTPTTAARIVLRSVEDVCEWPQQQWSIVSLKDLSMPAEAAVAIQFSAALSRAHVVLVEVPAVWMSWWSLVPLSAPSAPVASFHVAYQCGECQDVHDILVDRREHAAALQAHCAPPQTCPNCQRNMSSCEDLSFFSLVASPLPPWPEAVHEALGAITRAVRVEPQAMVLGGGAGALWMTADVHISQSLRAHAPRMPKPTVVRCEAMQQFDVNAVERFSALLRLLREPWLVQASPELLQGLSLMLHGFARAKVASVDVPFRCDACGPTTVTLHAADVAHVDQQRCERCGAGTPMTPMFGERIRLLLHTIPWELAPAAVAQAIARSHVLPSTLLQPVGVVTAETSFAAASVHTPMSNTPQGSESHARFEIIRRLGTGGMAETLLGRQFGIGGFEKRVVIKQILPGLAQDPAFVELFLHEARVAARINHSNVVQIFDFGFANQNYYIVMEYVNGGDLAMLLRAAQRQTIEMPIELAVRVAIDLCAGLSAAHNARNAQGELEPIIHCDVSPHNVLVSSDGLVKLADFGIARFGSQPNNDPGNLQGKLAYMAPEVVRGELLTPKIDIYAAGLVLYTMLCGKNPMQRSSDVQTLYAVANEPPPSILQARKDVPFSLAAVIGRAIHRDASVRFDSAQAMQLHLENFLAEYARPASATHLALWASQLLQDDRGSAPQPATPSSSLQMLELGRLQQPDTEATRVLPASQPDCHHNDSDHKNDE